MKILLGWLLLSGVLHAQTLGEAVQQVRDSSAVLITKRQLQAETWGQKTAIEDLESLQKSAEVLLESLQSRDARSLVEAQRDFSSQASRVRSSSPLLPDAPSDTEAVQELLGQVRAVDNRLTEIRTRFAEKASRVPQSLGDEPLQSDSQAFELYENPQALLIDIRDARQLAASLETGRLPQFGFGLAQPNNLDSLQVRRFIQAGWALQRAAEGNFGDISELTPQWEKFRFEYDRLGYPGSTQVTRQLERVMDRLTAFFKESAAQAP